MGLIPLRNFAVLDTEKGLYRSAQPLHDYEYQWLRDTLGIKTIVNLRNELNHDDKIATKYGMLVVNYAIADHHCPNKEQAQHFLELITDDNHFPLLFHCEHGRGRTSTFSVLAHIAMGMTVKEAIEHEDKHYHYQFKHQTQKLFLLHNFSDMNISNQVIYECITQGGFQSTNGRFYPEGKQISGDVYDFLPATKQALFIESAKKMQPKAKKAAYHIHPGLQTASNDLP